MPAHRRRQPASGQIVGLLTGLIPGVIIPRLAAVHDRRRLGVQFRERGGRVSRTAADVGLFTSVVEGCGLSLNEMLESGMPVYATRVGAVPDLQPYFRGMLRRFPPGPGERFAIDRASAELGEYYETFSWSAIARRYVGLLRAARQEAG